VMPSIRVLLATLQQAKRPPAYKKRNPHCDLYWISYTWMLPSVPPQ